MPHDAHRFGEGRVCRTDHSRTHFLRQNVIWPDKVSDSLQLRIGDGLYQSSAACREQNGWVAAAPDLRPLPEQRVARDTG